MGSRMSCLSRSFSMYEVSQVMTAKQKFQIGDRVKLSHAGHEQFKYMYMRSHRGTVTGYGRSPHMVAVKLDKRITPDRYHVDFWEKM